jgi:hypothetical protein
LEKQERLYYISQNDANEYNMNIWGNRRIVLWVELLPEECLICGIRHRTGGYRWLYICKKTGTQDKDKEED